MNDYKPPPKAIEAEAALIASVLTGDEFTAEVCGMLTDASAFYRAEHATIWQVILDFQMRGEPIDCVTVARECESRGMNMLDETSMFTALGQMLIEHPLNYYAVTYARQILRAARLRVIIETANEMLRDAYANRDEPDAVLERGIASLKGEETKSQPETETAEQLLPRIVHDLEQRARGYLTGVMTPYTMLNSLTGGLQKQDLIIIAARTSMGKTSLAMNLAAGVAMDQNLPTLVVSLEMGNTLIAERTLAFRSDVHAMRFRTGKFTLEERERFNRASHQIACSPLHFAKKPGRTLGRIVSNIRRAHAKLRLKLIIIDYIQQVNTGRNGSLYETTTQVAKELKDLANDLETPVVALSQLNRTAPNREDKRPVMTDLRDSGAIEEAADLILLLHRPEYYDSSNQPGLAELRLAKNRNGPPGDIRLRFTKETMLFEDWKDDGRVVDDSGVDWTRN